MYRSTLTEDIWEIGTKMPCVLTLSCYRFSSSWQALCFCWGNLTVMLSSRKLNRQGFEFLGVKVLGD
eukprot:c14468_g1_i1 orf=93-293(+)